jgi:Family of unknown function (DUF6496)
MAKSSPSQRKTAGRVMHEFKHGELKSGRGGKGGKVKSRRQAIAIALSESGASKYESRRENKRNLARSKRKEARGETGQQEREGKSHVGARAGVNRPAAMGGKNATRRTARGAEGRPRRNSTSAPRRAASRAVPRCRSANCKTRWASLPLAYQNCHGRACPGHPDVMPAKAGIQ